MKELSSKQPDISGRIANLSPEKRALLEKALCKKNSAETRPRKLSKRTEGATIPLSTAQERIWFIEQLEPGTPIYNRPSALRLIGKFNVHALEESLRAIVQRHELLRTRFVEQDGQPTQTMTGACAVALPFLDLENYPLQERQARALQLAVKQANEPFNINSFPLWRVALVRFNEEDHLLLATFHHMIFDGWSMSVFVKELAAFYDAYCTGRVPSVPPLAIQYGDFACYQRELMAAPDMAPHVAYWRNHLRKCPSFLELPTDFPRLQEHSVGGALQTWQLSAELTDHLLQLSRQENSTLYMTLLAAFAITLMRYSGQREIVIGTPVSGRSLQEMEPLIGVFINTLPLRIDFSGEPGFRELLQRVRTETLNAFSHQALPFEKIVEAAKPQRILHQTPLFQVLFQLRNLPETKAAAQGLIIEQFEFDPGIAKTNLALDIESRDEGLQCLLEYSKDLFEEKSMKGLLQSYQALLESIVRDIDQPVTRLKILSDEEMHRQLVALNETEQEFPEDYCIHELIEQQVERSPKATAVLFQNEVLSYHELNRRANQLAHRLRKLGVRPDTPIGICCESSLEMPVALLGILKAGGAYLPIDPAYPSDRIKFMLTDSQCRILLTQKHLADKLPDCGQHNLLLDKDNDEIMQERADNPTPLAKPDNLAYIIYTSGSTGMPKGVLITHRGLVNHNTAVIDLFKLTPADRMLQFSSISFDLAVEEIFPVWMAGGTLVLRDNNELLSSEELAGLISRHKVTVLDLPTAYWHAWVQECTVLGKDIPSTVRLVVVGGEKASRDIYESWLRLAGTHVSWLNTYGPTETTVVATVYDPAKDLENLPLEREIPIGRPIANMQAYIFDEYMQPVIAGAPGELYLGGAGLARGYLNQPELTEERFMTNPFSDEPGARLYRTGDRARFRADGVIEYLGRVDDQIKLRGFRIELGEIETLLCRHPAVGEAAVVLREEAENQPQLAAYVVLKNSQHPTIQELHAHLSGHLPSYMVPALFEIIPKMPLTSSGKIDRYALPTPKQKLMSTEEAFAKPRDPLEQQLANLWESVLGVSPIGINQNFFDLGGHSLLAVRAFALMEKQLGKHLAVSAIFKAPTIAGLAELIRKDSPPSSISLIPIQVFGSRLPFFCVLGAEQNATTVSELARRLGNDQPFYVFQEPDLGSESHTFSSVEEMASQYIEEMQTVQPDGPYFLGGHCFGGLVAYEMAQQLLARGEKVGLLGLMETFGPNSPDRFTFRARIKKLLVRLNGYSARQWFLIIFAASCHLLQQVAAKVWHRLMRRFSSDVAILPPTIDYNFYRDIVAHYKVEIYPGKLTVYKAAMQHYFERDPLLWWGPWVRGGIEICNVSGEHNSILDRPHVDIIAQHITHCIQEEQEQTTQPLQKAA